MSEKDHEDNEAANPEQAAALGQEPEENDEEAVEQDETDNTTIDSEEHSDAPGPFGTG